MNIFDLLKKREKPVEKVVVNEYKDAHHLLFEHKYGYAHADTFMECGKYFVSCYSTDGPRGISVVSGLNAYYEYDAEGVTYREVYDKFKAEYKKLIDARVRKEKLSEVKKMKAKNRVKR